MKKAIVLALFLALLVPSFAVAAPRTEVSQSKVESVYRKSEGAYSKTNLVFYKGCYYQKMKNVYRKGSRDKIWVCTAIGG